MSLIGDNTNRKIIMHYGNSRFQPYYIRFENTIFTLMYIWLILKFQLSRKLIINLFRMIGMPITEKYSTKIEK